MRTTDTVPYPRVDNAIDTKSIRVGRWKGAGSRVGGDVGHRGGSGRNIWTRSRQDSDPGLHAARQSS